MTSGTSILGGPAVSPDGTTLAIAQSATVGDASTESVSLFPLATGTLTAFTAAGDDEPAFDSSGTLLAVTSTRYEADNPDVVLLGASDASTPFRLTSDPAIDGQPAFQGR